MPARMRVRTTDEQSKERLRSHTAELLHEVYRGHVKMVAAELGVSLSRIYNQTEGLCANQLELLVRSLDRVVLETGEPGAIAPILAFLNQRYRNDDTPGDGIEDELAAFTRAAGELIARIVEMQADGQIDEHEAESIEQHGAQLRALLRQLSGEAMKVARANGGAPTH